MLRCARVYGVLGIKPRPVRLHESALPLSHISSPQSLDLKEPQRLETLFGLRMFNFLDNRCVLLS